MPRQWAHWFAMTRKGAGGEQGGSDTSSAPSGHLPLKGKADGGGRKHQCAHWFAMTRKGGGWEQGGRRHLIRPAGTFPSRGRLERAGVAAGDALPRNDVQGGRPGETRGERTNVDMRAAEGVGSYEEKAGEAGGGRKPLSHAACRMTAPLAGEPGSRDGGKFVLAFFAKLYYNVTKDTGF